MLITTVFAMISHACDTSSSAANCDANKPQTIQDLKTYFSKAKKMDSSELNSVLLEMNVKSMYKSLGTDFYKLPKIIMTHHLYDDTTVEMLDLDVVNDSFYYDTTAEECLVAFGNGEVTYHKIPLDELKSKLGKFGYAYKDDYTMNFVVGIRSWIDFVHESKNYKSSQILYKLTQKLDDMLNNRQ